MVTVWVDCGSEGWQPNDFQTPEEIARYIHAGNIYGAIRITKEIEIKIDIADKED